MRGGDHPDRDRQEGQAAVRRAQVPELDRAIWDALVARDTGCVFPGCTVPAEYCIGHHLKFWTEHHGPTELNNGALVCPRHHVDVHHHGWTVRLDEHGIPEVIPPRWIDPDQLPRRNHHWRNQRDLLRPPEFPDVE